MTDESLSPAQEYVRASSLVTVLLATLARGEPVDAEALEQARVRESVALSHYIVSSIQVKVAETLSEE